MHQVWSAPRGDVQQELVCDGRQHGLQGGRAARAQQLPVLGRRRHRPLADQMPVQLQPIPIQPAQCNSVVLPSEEVPCMARKTKNKMHKRRRRRRSVQDKGAFDSKVQQLLRRIS